MKRSKDATSVKLAKSALESVDALRKAVKKWVVASMSGSADTFMAAAPPHPDSSFIVKIQPYSTPPRLLEVQGMADPIRHWESIRRMSLPLSRQFKCPCCLPGKADRSDQAL